MNPYIAIAAFIAAFSSGWLVHGWKTDAALLRDEQVIQKAEEGAARAIAKIEVKQVTIRQNLEREIREKTVYADCRNSPDGMRLLNSALVGFGDSKLPRIDTSK